MTYNSAQVVMIHCKSSRAAHRQSCVLTGPIHATIRCKSSRAAHRQSCVLTGPIHATIRCKSSRAAHRQSCVETGLIQLMFGLGPFSLGSPDRGSACSRRVGRTARCRRALPQRSTCRIEGSRCPDEDGCTPPRTSPSHRPLALPATKCHLGVNATQQRH